MAGRPKADLILSENEKHQLEAYTRRRKTSQAPALRLRIILECSGGITNVMVAEKLGITQYTVGKWRRRFIEKRKIEEDLWFIPENYSDYNYS